MTPDGMTQPMPSGSGSESASIMAPSASGDRIFQGLLERRTTPERCIEVYHLCRSEFERAIEVKLRARALSGDGNID
jgi:hypothetical protein